MDKTKKIQNLLIEHLMAKGHIELTLPDGMKVELGVVRENGVGELEIKDQYSWIIATQKGREISMDSFNFGLQYDAGMGKIIVEEDTISKDGKEIKILSAA